jgi:hypothetical protein
VRLHRRRPPPRVHPLVAAPVTLCSLPVCWNSSPVSLCSLPVCWNSMVID